MNIYTIGFTKKGAEEFFGLLEQSEIDTIVDVRLRNRSQLAGFAKRDDLIYFLDELLDATYEHRPLLAPTEDLLDDWRNDTIDWETYENRFWNLMDKRQIEENLEPDIFSLPTALLCSEHEPDQCHRRIIVEYLNEHWGNVEPVHLQ